VNIPSGYRAQQHDEEARCAPKANAARKMLLQAIEARLAGSGFVMKSREARLVREFLGMRGRAYVYFPSAKIGKALDFMVQIGLRFDDVEDLANGCDSGIDPRFWSISDTLSTNISNIAKKAMYVTIAGAGDVADAADKLANMVDAVGLPAIDRLSDPIEALSVLACDDEEDSKYCPINYMRAMRACAMLRVLGRNDEIAELGARKMEWLRAKKQDGVDRLALLLKKLAEG
jgi:hypothetical protein